jgi:hypothetical protein
MNYESFKNPDPLFHGTDFWMLNGDLNDEEIERRIGKLGTILPLPRRKQFDAYFVYNYLYSSIITPAPLPKTLPSSS